MFEKYSLITSYSLFSLASIDLNSVSEDNRFSDVFKWFKDKFQLGGIFVSGSRSSKNKNKCTCFLLIVPAK